MIFQSCKRVATVTSLSAMSTSAGFLTFQGKNAINDALQMINIQFTNDPTKGLYFNNITNNSKT